MHICQKHLLTFLTQVFSSAGVTPERQASAPPFVVMDQTSTYNEPPAVKMPTTLLQTTIYSPKTGFQEVTQHQRNQQPQLLNDHPQKEQVASSEVSSWTSEISGNTGPNNNDYSPCSTENAIGIPSKNAYSYNQAG